MSHFSLLFCFPSWEIIMNIGVARNTQPVSAAWWKRIPGDAVARWVWFVHPSYTSEGWHASLLHWERASAMFTVMFQGMLRGFKRIKHIYRNTDIGNAMGSPVKGTDTQPKPHVPISAPWALTNCTKRNSHFKNVFLFEALSERWLQSQVKLLLSLKTAVYRTAPCFQCI